MLSIGKLVDPDYYLARVADGVEAYYSLEGESPGKWLGRGAARLQLDGRVEGGDLKAILATSDPATGEPLGTKAHRKTMGFDLCFRAPKSVSVLAGLGDPDTVPTVHACHDRAVAAAFDYLERTATWTRRGRDGVDVMRGDGLVAAGFRHRTSRAQDPHLHTHVLVANATLGTDGRWSTLDARFVYAHAKTAGYLYEAHLRAELTREMGVGWGAVRNGISDVGGVPAAVLRTFSKRRAEVQARLDERGLSSPRAAEVTTLDTRRRKTHTVEGGVLRDRWRAEAINNGFGPVEYAAVFRRGTPADLSAAAEEEMGVALSSPLGLTRHLSTFDRRGVLLGICDRLPSGASVTAVEEVADRYMARAEVINLGGASSQPLRRADGKVVPLHADGPIFSTAELLAVEERLLSGALARRDTDCGVATGETVAAALAARPTISAEQARLVVALATSGNGVDVVAAAAGTGKTFSLDGARDAWQRCGYRVIGCALAARAAAELEAGAGIASSTVARLLADLDDPNSGGLDRRTIVVCDEAAMVGSRTLERLAAYVADAGAKLVLCGDARQLPSVDAGGGFASLGRRLGALTLAENRRQHDVWERDALARLRSGQVDDAIGRYDEHGRVFRGPTASDVREALVAHWWAARTAGDSVLMLAARRSDVDDLNARARARMANAGKLAGPELVLADRPYQSGDRVMTLRNDYRLGVRNGTVGTVIDVDTGLRTIRVHTDRGGTVTLPARYLAGGQVTLAYASTVHKAQGQTVDHALLLGNDDLFLELGYVGLSRGRATNHLYIVDNPDSSEEERGTDTVSDDPYQQVLRSLGRSRAKTLAVDTQAARPRTLSELFSVRDRLAAVLAAAGPDPAADLGALRSRRDDLVESLERQKARLAETEVRQSGRRRRSRRGDPERAYALVNVNNLRRNLSDVDAEIAAAETRAETRRRHIELHTDDRARLDQIEQAIEAALARRLGEIGRHPPAYLTTSLGPIPDVRADRAAWWSAARQVEIYRAGHSITDETTPLGSIPPQYERILDWYEAENQLKVVAGRLRRHGPNLSRPRQHRADADIGL